MPDREQSGIRSAITGNMARPLHAKLADHAEAGAEVREQAVVNAILAVYYLLDERLPQVSSQRLTPRE